MGIYSTLSSILYPKSTVQRTSSSYSPTPVPTPTQPRVLTQDQMLSQYSFSPVGSPGSDQVFPSLNVNQQGQVLGAQTSSSPTGTRPSIGPSGNPFDPFAQAAQQQNDAELQSALSALDYNRGQLETGLASAGRQKEDLLSQISAGEASARSQAESSTKKAEEGTSQNIQDALTTAQEVQRKNRNILRSLGILNSSAAGELLSKPLNEYDVQRARLGQALTQRKDEIDTWMRDRVAEAQQAKNSIVSQYQGIVENIQNDLRFNDRQRADAVKAAGAALAQRLSELKMAQFNWEQQYKAASNNLGTTLSQLNAYQAPTANLQSINAQTVTPGQDQYSSNAQIFGGDERRRGDLLSGLAYS